MYNLTYYLTGGIYPKWSTFIQSISLPQGPNAELFAKVQEATRKDVERAFGCGARFWSIASSICDCEKPGAFMGQGKDRDDYENMYHTTQYDSRK